MKTAYDSHVVDQNSYAHELKDDDFIHNLTAKVVYNFSEEMLQYHISWEDDSLEHVTVTVKGDSAECNIFFQESADGTEVLIPEHGPDYDVFTLLSNCSYEIVVNDSTGRTSQLKHTIPTCIDGWCDCELMSPVPSVEEPIGYDRDTGFLVQWTLPENDVNVIKNVTFSTYKPNEKCKSGPSEGQIIEPDHTFITNTSAVVYSNNSEEKPEEDSTWINISSTVILVILLLVVIAFWYIDKCRGTIKAILFSRVLSRRRRPSASNIYGNVTNRTRIVTNDIYIEHEIIEGLTDSYELPRNHLELLYEIGKGAFGEVYLGKAKISGKDVRVAVKTLRPKSSNEEMEDFLSEIDIMKKIGRNTNIVTMLKSCTLQEPYMMIMEYLPFGDLKNYLVNLRDKWNNRRNALESNSNESASYITPNAPATPNSSQGKKTIPSTSTEYSNLSLTPTSLDDFTFDLEQILDHTELQNFALQIASGMAHLEKIPIAHRDLAARNILIDENKVLKISDFGLSRPGPYINKRHNKLPLRWMALEAIEDHLYDNKSDVWSFGIVLWEIGTLGAFPYGDVPDRMLIYHLQIGKRLPRPEICTDELYTLMLRCWSADPKLRPTFSELVQQLDFTKSRIYIDFTQLNPSYVFPPMKSHLKDKAKQEQAHVPKYLECP